eukprot:scaffold5884_cov110-Isochrysis_galbana.AAC.8
MSACRRCWRRGGAYSKRGERLAARVVASRGPGHIPSPFPLSASPLPHVAPLLCVWLCVVIHRYILVLEHSLKTEGQDSRWDGLVGVGGLSAAIACCNSWRGDD